MAARARRARALLHTVRVRGHRSTGGHARLGHTGYIACSCLKASQLWPRFAGEGCAKAKPVSQLVPAASRKWLPGSGGHGWN